jgi:predicted metalloprotease
MRIDDLRPTTNVDDRRGMGGGFPMGGGMGYGLGGIGFGSGAGFRGGGLGLIAIFILCLLFGINPLAILGGGGNVQAPSAYSDDQSSPGSQSDDAQFDFAKKIIGSTEDVWTAILAQRGITYVPAIFTPYDNETQTSCGDGQAAMGPFYCPADRRVYIDLSFFNELKDRFGAPGEFAQAYVLAHEVGHNVQNVLGVSDKVDQEEQSMDDDARNKLSVRVELQADCYAGVWANRANAQFHILQQGDVEDGLRAASAVGDDTLQKQEQGYIVPDSFTHGTSAQRVKWFKRGLARGDMDDCDTFSPSEAEL